jgi:arsenical pump membrane protein
VAAILLGAPLGVASVACAGLALAAFAVWGRSALTPALFPWQLLALVTGLFLVVQTIGHLGLGRVVAALVQGDDGPVGSLRAAATGVGLANALNNLPAYVAGEAVIPVAHHTQLLALLVGTNLGPVITPWASIATLLWYERCRAHGVRVSLWRLVLSGAVLATVVVPVTVATLLVLS